MRDGGAGSAVDGELEFSGSVPWTLDGLFVLPERVTSETTTTHGLRLCRGRPLWYASGARLQELAGREDFRADGSASHGLSIRVQTASTLAWQIASNDGTVLEYGDVAVDGPPRVVDAAPTRSFLVFVAAANEVSAGAGAQPFSYRLGVAARAPRARMHWFGGMHAGWASLLHACERNGQIVVDLARTDVPRATAATILRWQLNTADGSAALHASHALPLDWPTAHPTRFDELARYVYGVARPTAQTDGPALARLDQETGRLHARNLGFAREIGPPTFVPFFPRTRDKRGALLAVVYDAARDVSELMIFAVENLDQKPLATIRLPVAVRNPERGTWLRLADAASGTPGRG
jgi:carotenoid cleavage dioxygenase-like enzyme